jgi:hypothetical protein
MRTVTDHRDRRLSSLLVLLLQLGVGAFAPLAHAHTASPRASVHVETPGNESCPAVDAHGPCQICRTLQSPLAAAAERTEVVAVLRSTCAAPVPPTRISCNFDVCWPLGSRAPPLA